MGGDIVEVDHGHGPADLARAVGQAKGEGDGAVGGDSSGRNASHDGIDVVEEASAHARHRNRPESNDALRPVKPRKKEMRSGGPADPSATDQTRQTDQDDGAQDGD